MSNVVLDASVLIAIARNERIEDDMSAVTLGAYMSTVNVAEVLTVLSDKAPEATAEAHAFFGLLKSIEPFTLTHARLAASLRPHTRSAGLSLGDRACIALGAELDADIYTADRAWAKLKLPYRIRLIR